MMWAPVLIRDIMDASPTGVAGAQHRTPVPADTPSSNLKTPVWLEPSYMSSVLFAGHSTGSTEQGSGIAMGPVVQAALLSTIPFGLATVCMMVSSQTSHKSACDWGSGHGHSLAFLPLSWQCVSWTAPPYATPCAGERAPGKAGERAAVALRGAHFHSGRRAGQPAAVHGAGHLGGLPRAQRCHRRHLVDVRPAHELARGDAVQHQRRLRWGAPPAQGLGSSGLQCSHRRNHHSKVCM